MRPVKLKKKFDGSSKKFSYILIKCFFECVVKVLQVIPILYILILPQVHKCLANKEEDTHLNLNVTCVLSLQSSTYQNLNLDALHTPFMYYRKLVSRFC